jgi:uncharacterized membrane protein YjgN (DUF898 family)
MAKVTATYAGEGGGLFGLALRTSILTFLTLGIYRFWARTRIRRFIWSSIRLGGDRLEYTGTGLEKFLGFLVAVVVLAVYLGLVQLMLLYFGLHLVFEPRTEAEMIMQASVFYFSFLAVLPLMIFARYRARRYMLARTRFRGIRFGMEGSGWGYVWRAILHGLLTAVTLGIMLPRQTFWLEKYKTDRSWYGDARFEQGGKWTALYRAMKHMFIALGGIIVGGVLLALAGGRGGATGGGLAIVLLVVAYIWLLIGWAYYRVHAFRYLAAHKTLGGAVAFEAEPRTATVLRIVILGTLLVGLVAGIAFGILAAVLSIGFGAVVGGGAAPPVIGVVAIALLYMVVLALVWALQITRVTQPLIGHFAGTLTVVNVEALDEIRQRAADRSADAGGFAEALDVGGAI